MKNKLRYLPEFRKLLANYRIADEQKKLLEDIQLVLLTAPSASGRNTIIRELLKTGEYHFVISDTTRNPRINDGVLEQNGVNYWFRSEEEVLADIQSGKYLEAEVLHNQQASGISMRELDKAREENRIAINDVDIGGVKNILKVKPDTVAFLILPPSFEEWQRRLKHRGEMNEDERIRRMQTACTIFSDSLKEDNLNFIINDDVSEAAAQIHRLARLGTKDETKQEQGRRLAERLYQETKDYLEAGQHS